MHDAHLLNSRHILINRYPLKIVLGNRLTKDISLYWRTDGVWFITKLLLYPVANTFEKNTHLLHIELPPAILNYDQNRSTTGLKIG